MNSSHVSSIYRYNAIIHPMRSKYTSTVSRARRVILVVWLIAFILASPILYGQVTTLILCSLSIIMTTIRKDGKEFTFTQQGALKADLKVYYTERKQVNLKMFSLVFV